MNSDNNSSSLIWEKVSSGDEKIPRLKSGDSSREDDDEDDEGDDNSGYSSSRSSSSVISSPGEIEKIEAAEKRSRNVKRTRKKHGGKKTTVSKSAQARSIMWYVCNAWSGSLSNRTSQRRPPSRFQVQRTLRERDAQHGGTVDALHQGRSLQIIPTGGGGGEGGRRCRGRRRA